jgi:hypothetical protein
MARFIPNENSFIGFVLTGPTSTTSGTWAVSVADLADIVDLTSFTTSLNASSQGNNVPTPNFSTLFETSILGTSQATFTADFYRDDTTDTAWDTLPRKTKGFFLISRFGGPIAAVGDKGECWPVRVTSRSMAAMANNTVETFTLTCAVPDEPDEDFTVIA